MTLEAEDFYSMDIEFSLIGHVLCDNSMMSKLSQIQPDDFYSRQHADIWEAMEKLFRKGESISPFTIAPFIKDPEMFDLTKGVINYLAGSISHSLIYPWPVDQEKYLIRMAQKRDLLSACRYVAEGGANTSPIESAAFLEGVSTRIRQSIPLDSFEDNFQVTKNIIDGLKEHKEPFSTGFVKLDKAMGGGLYPGKCYGFAARKKHGKTTLGGTISHNLNLNGVKHLFICGEMSPVEIQQRTIARATESFASAFRGEYGKSDAFYKKLTKYLESTPRNTLYKNAPGLTFNELRSIYTTAIEHHDVKGVILDYWQLVGGKGKSQSTAEHLDDVAQWIADFSRKKSIWSIVMAQINQEGNTRGGEGIRLAFDQVYNLQAPNNDSSRSDRWLEMMETRYTAWQNVGSENSPGYLLNEKGPFFEETL